MGRQCWQKRSRAKVEARTRFKIKTPLGSDVHKQRWSSGVDEISAFTESLERWIESKEIKRLKPYKASHVEHFQHQQFGRTHSTNATTGSNSKARCPAGNLSGISAGAELGLRSGP
jgi:hypothetical protein